MSKEAGEGGVADNRREFGRLCRESGDLHFAAFWRPSAKKGSNAAKHALLFDDGDKAMRSPMIDKSILIGLV